MAVQLMNSHDSWRNEVARCFQAEDVRLRAIVSQLRSQGLTPNQTREELERSYGQVWDQAEFERDFWVHYYINGRPHIVVRRKSDLVRLRISYQDDPRLYFRQPD